MSVVKTFLFILHIEMKETLDECHKIREFKCKHTVVDLRLAVLELVIKWTIDSNNLFQ